MLKLSSFVMALSLASTTAYACKPAPSCWADSGPEYLRGICKDYAKETLAQITNELKDEPGYVDGDSLAFVKECNKLHVHISTKHAVEDSTIYCDSIGDEHGSNLSIDAGDRLKSRLPVGALDYTSDCVMSSVIAAECSLHPKMSINQAIDSLVSKVNDGERLPDIPRCGA
jgi:hypothetical protein